MLSGTLAVLGDYIDADPGRALARGPGDPPVVQAHVWWR
jgi:hypothetical protein